jgi:hypothetical protein
MWAAHELELPAEERAALIDHVEQCASCAEDWRLTAELAGRPAPAVARATRPLRFASLAALLAIVAFGGWLALRESPLSDRSRADVTIRSLLEEHEPLPRDAFVLRWTPGPEGTIYDVEVGTSDLESVTRAFALRDPEYAVPAEKLAGLSAGTEIAWRVQATLPDGRVVASVTHLNPIR